MKSTPLELQRPRLPFHRPEFRLNGNDTTKKIVNIFRENFYIFHPLGSFPWLSRRKKMTEIMLKASTQFGRYLLRCRIDRNVSIKTQKITFCEIRKTSLHMVKPREGVIIDHGLVVIKPLGRFT